MTISYFNTGGEMAVYTELGHAREVLEKYDKSRFPDFKTFNEITDPEEIKKSLFLVGVFASDGGYVMATLNSIRALELSNMPCEKTDGNLVMLFNYTDVYCIPEFLR